MSAEPGLQRRRVRAQFSGRAPAYVTSPGHAGGADLERLVAWGRALRPSRVLDVATGGGHTALAFAPLAGRVVAVDLTEAMVRAARAFARDRGGAGVVWMVADVEALPFGPGAFDVVTCRIAPHHFADPAAALREMARVLAAGGTLLLEDILGHEDPECAAFITEVERRRDPSHVRAYSAPEWHTLLRQAGLRVTAEAVVPKVRVWAEWTARTGMSDAARRALEGYVRAAPERCRRAFAFRLTPEGVEAFTDRMILLRAVRG